MQLIQDRRALHRIPELDDRLPNTVNYLYQALSPLKCKIFSPIEGAVCAYFDQGKSNTIAFRSDADALPIQEATGLPFSSTISGQMHACGHDGHMAMLLELARRLDRAKNLPNNILLIFQPSEETTGGARRICDSGVLSQYHVSTIFGMHLWPGLPAGVIASRKNEMMSRSCEVTIQITGRSSHVAKAALGIDAMAAGVECYRRCTAMEAALPENIFRLLKFGKLESGTVRNAISGYTRLEGTLRAFQDDIFLSMQQRIRAIGRDIEAEFGCQVTVDMNDGYPAVINPPALYDQVSSLVPFSALDAPVMITEDFSWYQQSLPAMFFFLGTGDTPALHAADFQFDETILYKGADFWQTLALAYPGKRNQEESPCSNI